MLYFTASGSNNCTERKKKKTAKRDTVKLGNSIISQFFKLGNVVFEHFGRFERSPPTLLDYIYYTTNRKLREIGFNGQCDNVRVYNSLRVLGKFRKMKTPRKNGKKIIKIII